MEDLQQFKQTYFEESGEFLGVAETGLLRLTPGNADMEEVNAIFRAVHSIKGGGGAFGFTDLVAFAHEFETVMDGVRNSTITITDDLVDTLIRANDVLGQLLAHARDGTRPPAGFAASVVAALKAFAASAVEESEDEAPAVPAPPPAAAGIAAGADGRRTFSVRFRPKADLLLTGNDPTFMLRALKALGETEIECDVGGLPTLAHLEPELIYLQWLVTLTTSHGLVDIQDIFEFVSDDSLVEITEHAADAPPPAAIKDEVLPPAAGAGAPPAVYATPEPAPGGGPAAAPGARPSGGRSSSAQSDAGHAANLGSHTIRVDLDKIDRLVNMVGEMVITQAMVAEHVRDLPQGEYQELLEGLEQLAQHTRELRENVMSIRAQPVGSVFSRMPRLVRELATETGKDVSLVTSGEATEVDKTVVENLVDPLTHMIRNSIDHGLESPDVREANGKSRTGTVHLSAAHRSGRIVIEVADDGKGIDRQRVMQKAIEKGLVQQGSSLSDEEIDNLIFLPGFSTADKISNISGRGVGMDVVRRNITSLGGRIGVYSTPGQGSRFVLSLPLTLAVLDGMVISVGAERFVLPLTNIVESLRPKPADLHGLVNRCDVMMARGEYVRLVYLHALFGIPGAVGDATKGLVVLVETEDGGRLGLVVDEVLGQQQVVIKSLESNYRRLDGVAAATILGDGRVALILDVAGLQEMSQHAGSSSSVAQRQISDASSQTHVM
ncbi:MAG: chemotaxis protein CheA [Rhodospirillaceae bacterium]